MTRLALAIALIAAAPAPTLVLRADGVAIGEAKLAFGAPEATAVSRLRPVLGRPLETRTIADCGQGRPMREARFRGDITITFLGGRFSGWTIGRRSRFRTDRAIGVGSTRAATLRAYPDASVDDASLGVMVTSETGPNGFLDRDGPAGRVVGLYAGETCMIS